MNAREQAAVRDGLARQAVAEREARREQAHAAAVAKPRTVRLPASERQLRRREQWLRSTRKRYARYSVLRARFGEGYRHQWASHLAELEKRAAT